LEDSEVNWAAMPLCGTFDTQDGALVLVGAFKENPLRNICNALGIDDLSADPRYCDMQQQMQNKGELHRIFRERFASNTRAYWLARLDAEDLLCAPVRDLREALTDGQTLHNAMILEGEANGRTLKFIGSPIHLSKAPVVMRRPPPLLGQHTEEALREAAAS